MAIELFPFKITADELWSMIQNGISSTNEVNVQNVGSGMYSLGSIEGRNFLRFEARRRTNGGEQSATISFKISKARLPSNEFYHWSKFYFPPDYNGVIWDAVDARYEHGWTDALSPNTCLHQFPTDSYVAPYSSGSIQLYHSPVSYTDPTPLPYFRFQLYLATVPAYYNSPTDNLTYYTGWRDTKIATGYHSFTIPLGKVVTWETYLKMHESNGRIKHWFTIDGVRTLVYDIATSGSMTGHNYPKVCTNTVPVIDDVRLNARHYVAKEYLSFPQYVYHGPLTILDTQPIATPDGEPNLLVDSFPQGIPFTVRQA